MFLEIATAIIAPFIFLGCLVLIIRRRGISDVKRNQNYAFDIKVILSDSHIYEFKAYSNHPYSSIAEIVEIENIMKGKDKHGKRELIEFSYQGEQILLQRAKISSVTMQREPTGLGKKDDKKGLRDMIKEKCKKERKLKR